MFVFPQRRAYEGRLPRRPIESQAGELTPIEVSRASVRHKVLVTEGEAGIVSQVSSQAATVALWCVWSRGSLSWGCGLSEFS